MAIKPIASFSSGELDPALHERTTLQKYSSGLKTARGVVVGKTGRLISRPGRKWYQECKHADREVIIHAMSHNGCYLEWGHQYVRIYNTALNILIAELSHAFTEDDLEHIHFADVDFYTIKIFRKGEVPLVLDLASGVPVWKTDFFYIETAPSFVSNTLTGTGYPVDYAISTIIDGQESNYSILSGAALLPITSATRNTIVYKAVAATLLPGTGAITDRVTAMKVYRRPKDGGAFGYIGTTVSNVVSGADLNFTFIDVGQDADYSHTLPTYAPTLHSQGLSSPTQLESKTGILYQQRLILSYGDKIEASRPGFPRNFRRDYPYNNDSALSFQAGSKGYAEVLRMIDNDGLVVFTSQGVFVSLGALGIENLGLDRKGGWVIDDRVPPIAIPGGVLFVDSLTNSVRELKWSLENGSYIGEELSVFSDHLFQGNRIKSWAFQEGALPLLWVIFTDGTGATFTYENEQKMRAWTRHDFGDTDVEYVASTTSGGIYLNGTDPELRSKGEVIFVVNKGGTRHVEFGVPRFVSADTLEADSEADMGESIAAMDGMASWKRLINDELVDDTMTLAPVVSGEWSGDLTLSVTDDALFKSADLGVVGTIFRWFHPTDKSAIDLEVTARASDNSVTVSPSEEFPLEYATNPRLYETRQTFDGTSKYLYVGELTDYLTDDTLTVTPVAPGVWDGNLTLSIVDDAIFTVALWGAVGRVYYYRLADGTYITLTVASRTNNNEIVVTPSATFPSTDATDPVLWVARYAQFQLDHLDDEEISIVADGHVLASPNNDIDMYPTVSVTAGAVTLPNSARAAIVHFGRPYTADIETLDIDTVEQRPTLIESITCNKVYIKTLNSRGLFVGNRFPEMNSVKGYPEHPAQMVKLETYEVDYDEENPIIGNRYDQPTTRRYEVTLPGDWKTQGRICLRQVDPLHFEILSIIPDIDDQPRRNG